MTGPKTEERAMNLRRANRKMPRRRLDIPAEKINSLQPEFLKKFVNENGKIHLRRFKGVSAPLNRKSKREIKRARALNLM